MVAVGQVAGVEAVMLCKRCRNGTGRLDRRLFDYVVPFKPHDTTINQLCALTRTHRVAVLISKTLVPNLPSLR
jgi:hypothetical protein